MQLHRSRCSADPMFRHWTAVRPSSTSRTGPRRTVLKCVVRIFVLDPVFPGVPFGSQRYIVRSVEDASQNVDLTSPPKGVFIPCRGQPAHGRSQAVAGNIRCAPRPRTPELVSP